MKKIMISFVKTGEYCPENICMPPVRRAKLETIKNAEARGQYIAATAAVCALVGDRAQTFRYGVNGRPEVDGGYISTAHTQGMAGCVFGDIPVGMDIEKADRGLSENMKARFGTLDDWLALEACVKLTGEGLSGIRKYRRRGAEMHDMSGARIAYVRFFDHEGYRIAVCCGEEFEISIC